MTKLKCKPVFLPESNVPWIRRGLELGWVIPATVRMNSGEDPSGYIFSDETILNRSELDDLLKSPDVEIEIVNEMEFELDDWRKI